ncbi:MAG: smpB [Phycisphaerales bacterium]|nr:smpB [Phycisphaerales bacterium]
MAKPKPESSIRILNRRATHDYFIDVKVECGVVLMGTEVKSLRDGLGQINDAFGQIRGTELYLVNSYIDPYTKAAIVYNHDPRRERKLLVHKRERQKLEAELETKGTTLVPLVMYFKDGKVKVEMGVGRGKQSFDKRQTIKKKEMDREVKRAMSVRQ